jgi:hypothetical protein
MTMRNASLGDALRLQLTLLKITAAFPVHALFVYVASCVCTTTFARVAAAHPNENYSGSIRTTSNKLTIRFGAIQGLAMNDIAVDGFWAVHRNEEREANGDANTFLVENVSNEMVERNVCPNNGTHLKPSRDGSFDQRLFPSFG